MLPRFLSHCVLLVKEIVLANLAVMRLILDPKMKEKVHPQMVRFNVGLKSPMARLMLANSITLTPGTITMDTVEQDGQDYYYIHWIDVASADGVEAGNAIKGTLEKWIGRIWK